MPARPISARHRLRPAGVVLAALCAALLTVSGTAHAAPAAPPGAVGHDVSTPQCTTTLPASGAFAVVGLTGGRAFSVNPCFDAEYRWASGRPSAAAVYINTGNPAPTSNYYWPTSGTRDPALCRDATSTRDPGCAYDYGWHAAAAALAAADRTDRAIRGLTWWLDVEIANSWNGDRIANAADLQGALDLLRSKGVARVGIYSTGYQWTSITGGYSQSTAGTYRSAWRASFTPRFPLESAPLWIATVGDLASATAACSTTFTGAAAQLVQFHDASGLDADVVCRRW